MNALACHIARARELGEQRGDVEGISVQVYASAVGGGGCHHAFECGGSHLPSGHAVYAVIDEDYGYVFTAVGCMDGLGCAYGSKVAVALICEHQARGVEPFYGCCYRRCTTVGRFDPVNVNIVVGHHGASYRCYCYG